MTQIWDPTSASWKSVQSLHVWDANQWKEATQLWVWSVPLQEWITDVGPEWEGDNYEYVTQVIPIAGIGSLIEVLSVNTNATLSFLQDIYKYEEDRTHFVTPYPDDTIGLSASSTQVMIIIKSGSGTISVTVDAPYKFEEDRTHYVTPAPDDNIGLSALGVLIQLVSVGGTGNISVTDLIANTTEDRYNLAGTVSQGVGLGGAGSLVLSIYVNGLGGIEATHSVTKSTSSRLHNVPAFSQSTSLSATSAIDALFVEDAIGIVNTNQIISTSTSSRGHTINIGQSSGLGGSSTLVASTTITKVATLNIDQIVTRTTVSGLPSAPTNPGAVEDSGGGGNVDCSWNNAQTSHSNNVVNRAPDNGSNSPNTGSEVIVTQSLGPTTTTYDDNSSLSDGKYWYRYGAKNAYGTVYSSYVSVEIGDNGNGNGNGE